MCKLETIATGSSGNCYLLRTKKEVLVLDAGIPFREVKIALGFNIRQISGVVVTHEHG